MPVRAVTERFVLGSSASAEGVLLLRGSLTTDHTCEFRSAGDNVGAVLGDGDCWLTGLVPVFDSFKGVTKSP